MRNNAVSIAKGFAILLMVMGHSGAPSWFNQYIAMFHMPLFFFMSGYCFKTGYLEDWRTYIKKRVTGIYWPFVKWSVLFLLLHNVFFMLNIYNDSYGFNGHVSSMYGVKETLLKLLHIVTAMCDNEQLLGGYWFLHSLFFGSVIFYATRKVIGKIFVGGGILLCLAFVCKLFDVNVPYFGIGSRTFLAAFFIMCGHAFKFYQVKIPTQWYVLLACALLVGVGAYSFHTSMLSYTYVNILPYAIIAIIGTIMLFGISTLILQKDGKPSKFLVFVGGHTFDVLTWHFLSFKLVSLLLIWIYGLPIEHLAEFPVITDLAGRGWWLLYLLVGSGVPLSVVFIQNKLASNHQNITT